MKKRLHLIIEGKVQGVFFRDNTCSKAKELGLTGWIRNNSDNTVEAIFEGNEDKLKEMIEFCNKGPDGADVKKLNIIWEESDEEFVSFEIN